MRFAILAFLISVPAFAETCMQMNLKGHVRLDKTKMNLVVAEKTMSERKLTIELTTQHKLSPYINHYVNLKAIVKQNVVLVVEEVADDIRDPLNQNQNTELKKLKDVKCP